MAGDGARENCRVRFISTFSSFLFLFFVFIFCFFFLFCVDYSFFFLYGVFETRTDSVCKNRSASLLPKVSPSYFLPATFVSCRFDRPCYAVRKRHMKFSKNCCLLLTK